MDLAGVPRAEGNTRVNEVLELVGLGKFADVITSGCRLDLAGVPRAEGNTRVNEVLELVGLGK
ncbi:hypothetical protein CKJ90_32945, partial [Klebsiella pneumoniae]